MSLLNIILKDPKGLVLPKKAFFIFTFLKKSDLEVLLHLKNHHMDLLVLTLEEILTHVIIIIFIEVIVMEGYFIRYTDFTYKKDITNLHRDFNTVVVE